MDDDLRNYLRRKQAHYDAMTAMFEDFYKLESFDHEAWNTGKPLEACLTEEAAAPVMDKYPDAFDWLDDPEMERRLAEIQGTGPATKPAAAH